MPESSRKKAGQLYVRIDESLVKEYKEVLKGEGMTLTEDIESYLASRIGKKTKSRFVNSEEFDELAKKVVSIEERLGKLQAS